ncbi:hypothetical protein H8L32_05055 [Undibacterium sp. CY18W]|uniref:Uncharacterized protein n=1 Tax=Undibacterium hunanense TaxID=2762292 RepID=A0ABR6ZLS8_9BURK|nr:hypothetical protein [Undibacterium hunanense]MBC3916836.1 hypothetical protein [Undibacterium hunanense]
MILTKLVSLGLPAGELLPGFIIPVFGLANKRYIQYIGSSNKIIKFKRVFDNELSLDFQTLELTSALNIIKTENPLSLGINSDAIHAFTDLKNVYIGTQDYFLSLHTLALFEEQMNERLSEYPFTLASLYDFVRKPEIAIRLREDESTKSLFIKEKKRNAKVENQSPPYSSSHHLAIGKTPSSKTPETSVVTDAISFGHGLRNESRNSYAAA